MTLPRCVALITPCWPSSAIPNGIATHTEHLAASFRKLGVRVVLIAWVTDSKPCADEVIGIDQLFARTGFAGRVRNRLARTIRGEPDLIDARRTMLLKATRKAIDRYPIELIETEEAFGYPAALAELRRVPVVTRLHGPWFLNGEALGVPPDEAFARRVSMERSGIAEVDGVTSPSHDTLERTRRHYGLPIGNGVVLPSSCKIPDDAKCWHADRCEENRLAFIGRFDKHKGADLLIEAFGSLAAQRPHLRLDIVGPDRGIPGDDGRRVSLAEHLERVIPGRDIRERIQVHGPLSPENVAAVRLRAVMTIVPSRYETFGFTALEALAEGCPLVASDVGGLAEIVRRDETGLLFRCGDSQHLAAQVRRLLDDRHLARTLSTAARRDVATRFDPNAIAEQTLEFYASVLGSWTLAKS